MKFLIKMKHSKKADKVFREFEEEFEVEWKKSTRNLPFPLIKDLPMSVAFVPCKEGYECIVPFKVPVIGKILRGWRKKLAKNIEGTLDKNELVFESVKFKGD